MDSVAMMAVGKGPVVEYAFVAMMDEQPPFAAMTPE